MHKHIARCTQTVLLNIVKSQSCCNSISPFHTNKSLKIYNEGSGSSATVSPTTMEKLFSKLASKSKHPNNKVTVVGPCAVTAATAFTLLAKKITNQICILDVHDDQIRGEEMDLRFGSMFLDDAKIVASKDYAESADSKICIIAAGVPQDKHENEMDFIAKNAGIVEAVVPPLVKNSPNATLIVASEPVDLLTHLTWKISGHPMHRVIGTGTNLDSNKFRYLVAEKLGVAPSSCHGFIIGEHGERSVPVWSSLNIAGVRLRDIHPDIGTPNDTERWLDIHRKIVSSGALQRNLKGDVSWAMALTVANLCEAILHNANTIHTVSTYAKGEHHIFDEVFLSLPCVLGRAGVTEILRQQLTDVETAQLRKSVNSVAKLQESLKIVA